MLSTEAILPRTEEALTNGNVAVRNSVVRHLLHSLRCTRIPSHCELHSRPHKLASFAFRKILFTLLILKSCPPRALRSNLANLAAGHVFDASPR